MNKASGGDGIPVELFQRCCESAALNMPANLENSAVATGLEKVTFHSNPKERQKSKMAVWGGLKNSCEKKRGEKPRRKGKI